MVVALTIKEMSCLVIDLFYKSVRFLLCLYSDTKFFVCAVCFDSAIA